MSGPGAAAGGLAASLRALDEDQLNALRTRLGGSGAHRAQAGPSPVPRDGGPLPATFIQEQMWLIDQMLPGSSTYVVRFAWRIAGALDLRAFSRALGTVIRRHEALRTSLDLAGERVVQIVRADVETPFRSKDLRAAQDPRSAALEMLAQEAEAGFDLTSAPLLRVLVIRVSDEEYLLGVYLHHVITDAASNGILLREWAEEYRCLVEGRESRIAAPVLHYGDVAAWQRDRLTGAALDALTGHWNTKLAGLPAVAGVPLDRPRAAGLGAPGASRRLTIPPRTVLGLGALARAERVTAFMVAFAGLSTVLARWSGQRSVVVGCPVGGRAARGLDQVIGPLVNTLPFRLDLSRGMTGRQLLAAARDSAVDVFEHADLPFGRLVERLNPERSAEHHPVFQIGLTVRGKSGRVFILPGAEVSELALEDSRPAKYDCSFYLGTGDRAWRGSLDYNTGLFDAGTMDALAEGLCAFFADLAEDPERPVGSLAMGPLPERPLSAARVAAHDRGMAGGYVAPRDPWEQGVALVFSQVLGLERVGADDNFFAIGGHSMAALLAIERIRQITGRRLPLATLFGHPTVTQLAAAVRETGSDEAPRYVVPLDSSGQAPPLFFAPPAIGEAPLYFSLAGALGRSRPLFCLQPDGFFGGGDPGDLSLAEIACRYAEQIFEACAGGPFHLCGFSAAGRLALAVAEQARCLGRRPGAVVLLDSAPYGDVAPDPDLATVLCRWLDFAPASDELTGLDREGVIARTLSEGKRRGALPAGLEPGEFRRWCRRLELSARALAERWEPAYQGDVTLLVRERAGRDIAAEWTGLPVAALRPLPLDVDSHMGFVDGPQVELVARTLVRLLHEADRIGEQS